METIGPVYVASWKSLESVKVIKIRLWNDNCIDWIVNSWTGKNDGWFVVFGNSIVKLSSKSYGLPRKPKPNTHHIFFHI